MTLLWIFLAFVLVMVVAFAGLLRVAVRWGEEARELQQHGIEITGRVVEKRRTSRRGALSSWIRYEYVDQFGGTHRSRRNLVTPDAWESLVENGPIAIVYSERRPGVSLPKYLMDVAGRSQLDKPKIEITRS